MLSALVLYEVHPLARDALEPVARTLAALAPAAIEGVVRDVAIVGPEGANLDFIADHAGCACVTASGGAQLARGAAALRGPLAFVIRAGAIPEAGFVADLDDLLRAGGRGALLRLSPAGALQRVFPDIAPLAGVVAPCELAASGRASDLSALARLVRPAPTLRSRARLFK